MRNPPPRALLVALVALALVGVGAFVGAPVTGDALATSPSSDSSLHDAPNPSIERPIGEPLTAAATGSQTPDPAEQIDGEFDLTSTTVIRIQPTPDRDARWEVSVRYALADEAETAAFETAGDRFVDGEVGPSPALFEGFAREASRNVDRTMRIRDVDREEIVHEDPSEFDVAEDDTVAVGELRLTFVWTEFLETDGENLVLGEALTTPDNDTWLRSLGEDQTLEVATPEGYTVTGTPGATVPLRDNAVIIEGPRTFEDGERVAVVYAPTGAVGPPWELLIAAIVIAALLVAASILGYRRLDRGGTAAVTPNGGADGDGAGAGAAVDREADAPEAPPVGSPPGGGDGASETESEPEEDLSLLSDEERVERLLADNGGRMRQADIVAETGWSDAKVSQLLSAMADEERVEKLRLGRENLISIPDEAADGEAADGHGDEAAEGHNGDGGGDSDDR